MTEHAVSTAYEMGWSTLENGALLDSAESEFDLLVTTDQNLRHQQDLSRRKLAILVLPTTSWPVIRAHEADVVQAVGSMEPGEYRELGW